MQENKSNLKNRTLSPLADSVLTLDGYFHELIRLGEKIEAMELKTDFDFDQAQRLINHFTVTGDAVTKEVMRMSGALNDLREKAEGAAKTVAAKAEQLNDRKVDSSSKMDELRTLGDEVRVLAESLQDLKHVEGDVVTDEDRERIAKRLVEFETQLLPLIAKAQALQEEGRRSKMKLLEQSADSLKQSLLAITKRITVFQQTV